MVTKKDDIVKESVFLHLKRNEGRKESLWIPCPRLCGGIEEPEA